MRATEILTGEHRIILKVLDAAEREVGSIRGGGKVDGDKIEKIADFIRNFADHCHHAKEEGHLFRMMREKGMPVGGGPIAVMLQEHDLGRGYVKAVVAALPCARTGDAAAAAVIAENLAGYVKLLRQHISKEDNILYPMADRMFGAEDRERLAAEFDRVEAEEMGAGVHEKYHRLAHELAGD